MVRVSQVYRDLKTHQVVQFKYVQFIICQFTSIKPFKEKGNQRWCTCGILFSKCLLYARFTCSVLGIERVSEKWPCLQRAPHLARDETVSNVSPVC